MILINLNTVEDLIFRNQELPGLLPSLTHEFQQWSLGQQVPALRHLGKKAVIDGLNKLGEYQTVLERHFGDTIEITVLDYRVVKNVDAPADCVEGELCKLDGFTSLAMSRVGWHVYVSAWR